jgi:dihydroorotase
LAKSIENRIKTLNLIFANQSIAMTKNLEGKDMTHLENLSKNQVLFITDDGKGVDDDIVMEKILKIAKSKNIRILSHAETSIYSSFDMRKAENEMTFRDIALCEKTKGSIHFCHVSTKEAMQAMINAKDKGLDISCEVTPHHIFATGEQTNHYRVNPPFREQEDIDFLIFAIQNGYVDVIATDHAPHSDEDKRNGAPGISGIETAFSLCFTKLVKNGFISLPQLLKLMAYTPSKMMKLQKGAIDIGEQADFNILDLETPYIIDASKFVSKGKNTPFNGQKVYGRIISCRKF